MTLIKAIIEALTDTSKSLAGPLLKTKVMASRIGNEALFQWADTEIIGYNGKTPYEIPDYRRAKASYTYSYRRDSLVFQDQPFPLLLLKGNFRDQLVNYKFSDGVQSLEVKAAGENSDYLYKDYPIDACAVLTRHLSESARNIQILGFRESVSITEISQILSVIRSKLVDFMLHIEKEFPHFDDLIQQKVRLKEENQQVDKILSQVIIHAGNNNTIITGSENTLS